MKTSHLIIASALALSPIASASAGGFLDTESPSSLFNLGIRAGINTSTHTFDSRFFNEWNVNSWGTGLDAGVVFDINLRQYIALQPGFFFQSRSGNYSYIQDYTDPSGDIERYTQLGNYRSYYFNIPIMVSLRFNLASNVKWLVEAGPYFQLKLHSSDSEKIDVLVNNQDNSPILQTASANTTDFGLKAGSGILVNNHYSFSIHYLAGARDVWKAPFDGGRNKSWTFTLGYNF